MAVPEDVVVWIRCHFKKSDVESALTMFGSAVDHTGELVSPRLVRCAAVGRREAAEVRAPTLVLHARGDGMIPFEIGRQLAAHIQGARFVPLESRNHVLLETEPAWPRFVEEVRAFLGSDTPPIS
jgi:pimeloyl-ACP methyl ester carboxylesterase